MTAEVLLSPDAKQVTIVYLRAQLNARSANATVGDRVPKERGRFVTVKRVGGKVRQVVIEDSTVVVDCWADSAEEATDLAQLCRGLVYAMANSNQGGAIVFTVNDADFNDDRDPISDQPVSSFAVTISMRRTAA